MALFVESTCKLGHNTSSNLLSWSFVDPIAAVSLNTTDENGREAHQVVFINNEGEMVPNASINHDNGATAMDWQPTGRIFAVGWEDGSLSCYHVDGRQRPSASYTNNSQHNSPITVLKWNPFGKRLISGDNNGLVVVWTVDTRGALTSTRQYRKKGMITAAVFCVMSPLSRHKSDWKLTYSPPFFFGTDRGVVAYADDLGHCAPVQELASSIDTMLFYEEKSKLIIITRSLLLTQYLVAEDGRVTKGIQVKLSVAGEAVEFGLKSVVWAGPGLLATATHEKFVRLLDLASDESYNISLSTIGAEKNDRVTLVSFDPLDRYLAVGTKEGKLAVWRYHGPIRESAGSGSSNSGGVTRSNNNALSSSAADWEIHYVSQSKPSSYANNGSSPGKPAAFSHLQWGHGQGTLGAIRPEGFTVFTETILRQGMCENLVVMQVSSTEVSVHLSESSPFLCKTDMLIRGIAVGKTCFVVWSGKYARVYRVDGSGFEAMEPFQTNAKAIAIADSSHISDEAVFIAENGMVRVTNFIGTQKGSVSFSEVEGEPLHVSINNKFLAVITNKGVIKILDVTTPTGPKPIGSAGKFHDVTAAERNNLHVREIRVNCAGNRVAVLADFVEGALQIRHPDSRLHIFDRSKGDVKTYSFESQKRCPVSVFWDNTDDRLLVCEAVKRKRGAAATGTGAVTSSADLTRPASAAEDKGGGGSEAKSSSEIEGENEVEVVTFFATSENGIILQDSYPRKLPYGPLLGISVPDVFFRSVVTLKEDEEKKVGVNEEEEEGSVTVVSRIMRDFVGLQDIDESVKKALIDFSYNLALGKLDEAYRAVRSIESPGIWENMAQMCVKTRRLDVAEVCLGNMGHARGAAAVRESKNDRNASLETSVGVLAIHLGLLDDAAKLFREANRYDLLNKLYQSAGLWDRAIFTATEKDRIHLKTTHYHYAKHLESIGDVDNAIRNYELSGTSRTEVPRMLYTLGQVDELEDYVHQSDDAVLLKWWAAYLESNERFDKARKYYAKAGDHLSLVRIACFKGEYQMAGEIVQEAGDRAASYHFARQLEVQGEYREAISYFAQSGCYNHAIRLAKGYGLDSELMRFAVKSTPSLMLDCAVYYEAKGEIDKAVQLYHKGGDLPRALDLCFQSGNGSGKSSGVFDMLNTIAQDLGSETSPQTLARCAEFLMKHKQFEKAIELYIMAKRYLQAIEMCVIHKVTITEELAATLTPKDSMDSAERKDVLKELAHALKKQGAFVLASKKYTQAGDRLRAMKCLLRAGDTKAVIQFASISRNDEIYKLAANFLQQMNWHGSVDIMKAIINFYTKAKAFEHLAGFYDNCAQIEIDEYRDYEKAQGALREAYNSLVKANAKKDVVHDMESRIALLDKFVKARKLADRDPEAMVDICEDLLREPNLDATIRLGDCLAMLVEHFHKRRKYEDAYGYIQKMIQNKIDIHPYVRAEVIEQVYQSLGIALEEDAADSGGDGRNNGEDDEEDIGEDIEEAVEEEEDLDDDIDEEEDDVEDDEDSHRQRGAAPRGGGGGGGGGYGGKGTAASGGGGSGGGARSYRK